MKSVIVADWSDPIKFDIIDLPPALPGPGEVRLRVHTAAVNFGDALFATGRYQVKPEAPFTPGGECSGMISAVGPGVERYRQGDRVFATGFIGDSRNERRIIGCYAQELIVPEANLAHVPDGMTLTDAALFRSSYETALYALQKGRLLAGETLLVLGAGGATGRAAVELGKAIGATVIASASSSGRQAIARAGGADFVIDGQDPDWRTAVAELAGPHGVDVVFDPVGGPATERAFRTLGWEGRLLVIGFAAGGIAALPVNLPLMKGASLIGVNLIRMIENEPARADDNLRQLLDLHARGLLKMPPVARRYRLDQVSEAVAVVLAGTVDGRVVLSIGDDARDELGTDSLTAVQ